MKTQTLGLCKIMYNSNDKIIKKKAFNAHNRLQIRKIVIQTGITFNDNGKKNIATWLPAKKCAANSWKVKSVLCGMCR